MATHGLSDVDRLVGLGDVTPARVAKVEQTLTTQARLFDPFELSKCATRILECLDPDGAPDRDERHRRLRRLSLRRMHGGMWRISGELWPETGAALATVLRPLAAPRADNPAEGRIPERRTNGCTTPSTTRRTICSGWAACRRPAAYLRR